jgi:glycosyltransferase involved in cell wall biosynthesis
VGVHGQPVDFAAPEGVRLHLLNLPEDPRSAGVGFHAWLEKNPHDMLLMNDCSQLEQYWPCVPEHVGLVIVLHDDGRGWRRGIIEHQGCVDGVVGISRFIESILRREMPTFPGIVRTIYNGCDFPEPSGARAPNGLLNLLYVGSMDSFQKGVFDIPRILGRLSSIGRHLRLTLVGGEKEALRRALDNIGLVNKPLWKGRLLHSECLKIMGTSDILFMTSRCEAFGMVTVEAMAMGCVPVAYDIETGSREIIEDGRSGFLVPLGDYGAFASRILDLYHDRQRLAAMRAAAIERARSCFSAERMGRDYARLIEDIAEARTARRPARQDFSGFRARPVKRGLYYALLPGSLRTWIRDFVGRSPWLSYKLRRWRG